MNLDDLKLKFKLNGMDYAIVALVFFILGSVIF